MHELQEGIYLFNLIDDYILRIVGVCAIAHLQLLHIAKSAVLRTLADGEHTVKKVV
jgi:hypothetical protein